MEDYMKYYLICDCRENFKNYTTLQNLSYNDHPSFNNLKEILNALKSLGYDCEYFGGIPEIIHAIDNNMVFSNCRFINFTDGMAHLIYLIKRGLVHDYNFDPYHL